jgi:hypothetical protein
MTIYGLVDPSVKELFYVGRTTRTIEDRLAAHVQKAQRMKYGAHTIRARIRCVLAAGVIPTYVILERTDDPSREGAWMDYFRSQGLTLFNTYESRSRKLAEAAA